MGNKKNDNEDHDKNINVNKCWSEDSWRNQLFFPQPIRQKEFEVGKLLSMTCKVTY